MTEQISALVDNEISDGHLIDDLIDDASKHEQWQRYHLIGDIMRDEHQPGLNFDIAGSIAQALENEPAHFRPQSSANDSEDALTQSPAAQMKSSNVVNFFMRGGHYAIAASVAVAVLLGVSQFSGQSIDPPQPHQVFDTAPFSGMASPVSLKLGNSEPVVKQSSAQLSEEEMRAQKKRINAFLQDHQMQQRK